MLRELEQEQGSREQDYEGAHQGSLSQRLTCFTSTDKTVKQDKQMDDKLLWFAGQTDQCFSRT